MEGRNSSAFLGFQLFQLWIERDALEFSEDLSLTQGEKSGFVRVVIGDDHVFDLTSH